MLEISANSLAPFWHRENPRFQRTPQECWCFPATGGESGSGVAQKKTPWKLNASKGLLVAGTGFEPATLGL
jgi:hypothetical protein